MAAIQTPHDKPTAIGRLYTQAWMAGPSRYPWHVVSPAGAVLAAGSAMTQSSAEIAAEMEYNKLLHMYPVAEPAPVAAEWIRTHRVEYQTDAGAVCLSGPSTLSASLGTQQRFEYEFGCVARVVAVAEHSQFTNSDMARVDATPAAPVAELAPAITPGTAYHWIVKVDGKPTDIRGDSALATRQGKVRKSATPRSDVTIWYGQAVLWYVNGDLAQQRIAVSPDAGYMARVLP